MPGETLLGSSYHEYPGGKGLNQVVAATRAGGAAAFVSALGNDAAGDQLAEVLAAEGIAADAVQRIVGTATGRALITVDQQGENSIVVISGANALLRPAPLPDANVVLSQLEIPIDVVVDAFAQARALDRLTILNPAPSAELPAELLANCSIVIPNEHERERLGGIDRLFDLGVTAVITTLGSRGVDVETPAGHQHVEPFAVTPIDTTGAGDAFCGAFAVAIAEGSDAITASPLCRGCGSARHHSARSGAVPAPALRDRRPSDWRLKDRTIGRCDVAPCGIAPLVRGSSVPSRRSPRRGLCRA